LRYAPLVVHATHTKKKKKSGKTADRNIQTAVSIPRLQCRVSLHNVKVTVAAS